MLQLLRGGKGQLNHAPHTHQMQRERYQRQLLQSHGNIGPGTRHELLLLLVEMLQLLLLLVVVVGQRRRLGRRGRLRCA
jgi:hypothetical protein